MTSPARSLSAAFATLTVTLLLSTAVAYAQTGDTPTRDTYDDLVALFSDWRAFQAPPMVDGVPDYSAAVMARQYEALGDWRDRLAAIDTTGWPVAHQVDWYLVWAEMNGFDFDHRVLRPWARDPAFYVWFYPYATDIPKREGPNVYGYVELSAYQQPLSDADAATLALRLRHAPAVFAQAQKNLTGNARDLWLTGTRSIREQSHDLEAFAGTVESDHPDLAAAAREARKASDALAAWLDEQAPQKTGPSGVGKEEYTWCLRKVHLVPYSWDEQVALLRRELDRAHTSLRLEAHLNRDLPPLHRIDSAAEYDRRFNAAVDEYMAFLEDEEILPIEPYMEPALRSQVGHFAPADGLRGFFSEVTYRAPIVMRPHHHHWFDLAQMREAPHASPIRRTPLLYNIFDGRAEGMATGMEEMMMHAGLLDEKPRARELVWIMLAERAARGLGGLYQHGREMTFDEATHFASRWVPRGFLPADGSTIQHEEQLYLRQPGYGTSYVTGKLQIERLMAENSRQRGDAFVLKDFMKALDDAGLIPVSLIYWEMTGDKSMLEHALADD